MEKLQNYRADQERGLEAWGRSLQKAIPIIKEKMALGLLQEQSEEERRAMNERMMDKEVGGRLDMEGAG